MRIVVLICGSWICGSVLEIASAANPTLGSEATKESPNVLFLAVDDMKDWVGCLGGYEGTVHTPNIDRLALRGTLFSNAHCVSPKCAPSRAALLTGLRPSTTGLYDNSHWWLPNLQDITTLPNYFRQHNYRVAGAGKIFHHTAGNNPPNQWDDFQRLTFRNDPWFRGVELNYPWSRHEPYPDDFPYCGVAGLGHENDWGPLPIDNSTYDDALTADYAIGFLQQEQQQPFFLACGIFRPHLPWYVPAENFDCYPIQDIVIPPILENDLADVPAHGKRLASARRSDFEKIVAAGQLRQAVQAYLASITFADQQIGRVLDALDRSSHVHNTIVVLWSDHGWHLGEKRHWHKTTLWEEATRVPLIISASGMAPNRCGRPVSLLDVFPSLIDLAGLETTINLDGVSLRNLMQDPHLEWQRPAPTEFKSGNIAVRSERYRYIRYKDGGEELYDHSTDPYEWHNLAEDSQMTDVKLRLASWLPDRWAPAAETKSAFQFDPQTYTWIHNRTGVVTRGE